MLSDCPNKHFVHNNTNDSAHNILTDNCYDEDKNDWLPPVGAIKTDAEIVIDMGCRKKVKGLQMKNIKKKQGGTKKFTISLSDALDGPWNLVLTDEFPEQETYGCAPMQTFDLG